MESEPRQENRSWPTCGVPGVALVLEDEGVVWCKGGHVTVFGRTIGRVLVYDFAGSGDQSK